MLPKEKWWEVIASYNESIFPFQWIALIFLICITAYLVVGNEKKSNTIIKLYLFLMNGFIGIKFFFLSKGFPLPLRISQGILFLVISALIGIDIKWDRLQFEFPKEGWKQKFFVAGIISMLIYPFFGGILGREVNCWIIPGTLPCPTTAYTLLLFITAKKRDNKLLFFLLLLWAVPFPPTVQIPKYGVYEDLIMFAFGIVGLILWIREIFVKRDKMSNDNLKIWTENNS